jgi:2-oxoglutarate dehydrogenase E1 component
VTRLALDYRMTFHKDVVIDLVCLPPRSQRGRRTGNSASHVSGHSSEADDRQLYAERLAAEKAAGEADGMASAIVVRWMRQIAGATGTGLIKQHTVDWSKYQNAD